MGTDRVLMRPGGCVFALDCVFVHVQSWGDKYALSDKGEAASP